MVRGVELAKGFGKRQERCWRQRLIGQEQHEMLNEQVIETIEQHYAALLAQVDPCNDRANGGGQPVDRQGRLSHVCLPSAPRCSPRPQDDRTAVGSSIAHLRPTTLPGRIHALATPTARHRFATLSPTYQRVWERHPCYHGARHRRLPWQRSWRRARDRPARRTEKGALMPKVLITGGNKGIGFATTTCFLHHGYDIVIVARDFSAFPLREPQVQQVNFDVRHYRDTLLLDSRVLGDQQLNERRKQRFPPLAHVVHKLEEPQVQREFLL